MADVTVGESEPRDELEERWLPEPRRHLGRLFRRLITAAGGATQAHIDEAVGRAESRAEQRAEDIRARIDRALQPLEERAQRTIAQQQLEISELRAQLEEAEEAVARHLAKPSIFDGVIVLQGYEKAFDPDDQEQAEAAKKLVEQLGMFRESVILAPLGTHLSGVTPLESKDSEHRVVTLTPGERWSR